MIVTSSQKHDSFCKQFCNQFVYTSAYPLQLKPCQMFFLFIYFFFLNISPKSFRKLPQDSIFDLLAGEQYQYKCEIDASILNLFIASELYIYWDQRCCYKNFVGVSSTSPFRVSVWEFIGYTPTPIFNSFDTHELIYVSQRYVKVSFEFHSQDSSPSMGTWRVFHFFSRKALSVSFQFIRQLVHI